MRKLTVQYVPVRIQTKNMDGLTEVARRFGMTLVGSPMVVVVTSSGKRVDSAVGPEKLGGKDIFRLLQKGIAAETSAQRAATVIAVSGDVRKLRADNKTAEAVGLILPYMKIRSELTEPGDEPLVEVIEQLESEAADEIQEAKEKAKTANGPLLALIRLSKIQRVYGKLPGLKKQVVTAMAEVRKLSQDDKLAGKAKAIDRARAFEDRDDVQSAVRAYHQVISRYPKSTAANLSTKRIKQLESNSN